MSSPLNWIVPAVESSRRMIVRPSVDLPQPDSPTRPRVSPALISRSTPSTARTWATVRCKTPEATGNHVFSPRTDTSGSEVVQARVSWACAVSGILQLHAGLGDPASGELIPDAVQGRDVARAALDLERTPRVKGTPRRRCNQVWRHAFDRFQRFVPLGVEAWDRPQQ